MTTKKIAVSLGLAIGLHATVARGADVPADPSNYQDLLATLQPGDTLVLAPGEYTRLTISGVHGTADGWITIAGPTAGDPAVILGEACCNTVQLYDSSFVAVKNLVIDAQGLYVDGVNAKDSISHDIVIENNTLQGFPTDNQQIVGVNTKVTVWNWTIRGNTIVEAGTGIYLGGSAGDTPFVAGTIENNLVVNPLGYCMQIKHQLDYVAEPGMPAGPNQTVIRHNVFIKDDRESPDGDRPNLLVGGFPDAGPGTDDVYHVYGNLLFYNPREALFQATGRVSIHDNVFVGAGPSFPALVVTGHQGKSMRLAYVYNNTIYGGPTGISFGEAAAQDDAVFGNLVFADTPIAGPIADLRDNIEAAVADAPSYVVNPAVMLGAMDFYPLPGAVEGTAMDPAKVAQGPDFDRDYNGTDKGAFTFRGAYAGAGENPGCPLDAAIKEECGGGDEGGSSDGGTTGASGQDDGTGASASMGDGGGTSAGTGASAGDGSADGGGTDAGAGGDAGGGGGCGCRAPASTPVGGWALVMVALARRRRGRM